MDGSGPPGQPTCRPQLGGERISSGNPLPPSIRAEVVRLIQAGAGDATIGKAVGIHRETVRQIRKDLPA
jgi:hypothetical protein